MVCWPSCVFRVKMQNYEHDWYEGNLYRKDEEDFIKEREGKKKLILEFTNVI